MLWMDSSTPQELIDRDPGAIARRIVHIASDRQASDILLLDIRGVVSYTDYVIIMSAGNLRQMVSIASDLHRVVKSSSLPLRPWEGTAGSGWLLLDCTDVVIHVLSEEQRSYYKLEQVWPRAKTVIRIQ